ncbi:MAG: nucleotidyltransferase family protein [Planctomycetota bacterium]
MNYTLARNIIIYSELDKILTAFDPAGIKVIVLSGAALGKTVYPSMAERPMGDIDLLIRHRDRQSIGGLLAGLGYSLETSRSDEEHYSKTIGDPASHITSASGCQDSGVCAGFTLHIDCHTDLRHYLDDRALAGVWSRARPPSLIPSLSSVIPAKAGIHPLILSPEDTLIYTAVDAAIYHGRITPTVLKDIELIIKRYSCHEPACRQGRDTKTRRFPLVPLCLSGSIDWSIIIKRIKSYRLETPLYILFDLCRKEGIPIPVEVMTALRPRHRSLEYRLYYSTLCAPRFTLYDTEDASRVLRFITRPACRWEIFRNSFFPSGQFISQQYNFPSKKTCPVLDTEMGAGVCQSGFRGELYYALRSTLYPQRSLALLWRLNKALGQLAMRIL